MTLIFYVSMTTIFLLCDLVNMELSNLSKWFSVNKVSLKSYMLFGNRHANDNIQICIDREE